MEVFSEKPRVSIFLEFLHYSIYSLGVQVQHSTLKIATPLFNYLFFSGEVRGILGQAEIEMSVYEYGIVTI